MAYKMKGFSGFGNSPLKQTDTIPEWSMSAKHFKKDVGHGSRSRTDPYKMQDDKYYYTYAKPKSPHGTRTEKSLFDKVIYKTSKIRNYIKHDVLGIKRHEQIKKEKEAENQKQMWESEEKAKFDRFLQDFPFEEGKK